MELNEMSVVQIKAEMAKEKSKGKALRNNTFLSEALLELRARKGNPVKKPFVRYNQNWLHSVKNRIKGHNANSFYVQKIPVYKTITTQDMFRKKPDADGNPVRIHKGSTITVFVGYKSIIHQQVVLTDKPNERFNQFRR